MFNCLHFSKEQHCLVVYTPRFWENNIVELSAVLELERTIVQLFTLTDFERISLSSCLHFSFSKEHRCRIVYTSRVWKSIIVYLFTLLEFEQFLIVNLFSFLGFERTSLFNSLHFYNLKDHHCLIVYTSRIWKNSIVKLCTLLDFERNIIVQLFTLLDFERTSLFNCLHLYAL